MSSSAGASLLPAQQGHDIVLGLVHLDLALEALDGRFAQLVGGQRLLGDLAQRDHRVLVVVAVDGQRRAGGERPRPVRREHDELEAVRHLVDAVFDGYAGHAADLQLRLAGKRSI